MKPALLLLLGALMITCPLDTTMAADETEAKIAAMEAHIKRLESELDTAHRTIEELRAEQVSSDQSGPAQADATATVAATAQPEAPESQTSPPHSAQATGKVAKVDETAARREQDMQSFAGSITILGPEALSLGAVEDVSRLELLVPGLRFGQSGHEARLAMRGARTNNVGSEAEQVVAVYEDGVYMPTTTQAMETFLDVQSVEVLRGPQGMRYGHNAFAGAINIISNQPTFDDIKGFAKLQNGLPDRTRFEVAINLPTSDSFAIRVAGLSDSRSGLIGNQVVESDVDDLNDRVVQILRVSARWQPTDNFDALLSSRYLDENGSGTAIWGYQQIGAYVDGELKPGHQFLPPGATRDIGPWDVFRNYASAAEQENWLTTLTLNWDIGFADLEWISNYTTFEGLQVYDNDYSDGGDPYRSDFAGWESSQDSWSTEMRMSSNNGEALDWLVGLYLYDQQADWGWLASGKGFYFQPEWDIHGTYQSRTKAVFGQLDYAVNDRFRLSGGLRWNKDNKTMKSGEKGSWDDVLWKAALEYDLRENMMSYFTASTGYRAGGINTTPGVPPIYDPEKVTAWEIGLKTMLAEGSMMLNVAAFYNDYSDLQSQAFVVLPVPGSPGATEYTTDGGSSDASGVEVEFQWAPGNNWHLGANIAYLDAKFGKYRVPNMPGLGDIPGHTDGDWLSLDGWRPAMSPKWTVGLQASYDWHVNNWGIITPYLQTTYMSDYYAADINLAGTLQDSHNRTDARLIWTAPKGNINIQIYYLNIEDEAQLNRVVVFNPAARPDIASLQANWTDPRTYGVIFSYTY